MKTNLYIRPRCSGKTTDLLQKFNSVNKQNPNESLFIVPNIQIRNMVRAMTPYRQQVFTVEELQNIFIGLSPFNNIYLNKITTIFIDEYFSMQKFYPFIFELATKYDIEAIGTPVEQFFSSDVSSVKKWWSILYTDFQDIDYRILKSQNEMIETFGVDIMMNLLVHPNTNVVLPWQSDQKRYMSKEQYEMEVEGKIFK